MTAKDLRGHVVSLSSPLLYLNWKVLFPTNTDAISIFARHAPVSADEQKVKFETARTHNNASPYNTWTYQDHTSLSCTAAHVPCSQFLYHLHWMIQHPTIKMCVTVMSNVQSLLSCRMLYCTGPNMSCAMCKNAITVIPVNSIWLRWLKILFATPLLLYVKSSNVKSLSSVILAWCLASSLR